MWRGYRGSTWPQVGDRIRVKGSGAIGVVDEIVGHGTDERFIVVTLDDETHHCRRAYALVEIQRAEPPPIDRL